jgi:6-pyruvoyltetrahydropterin/6-carboxytetrahydropterin synthase
MGETYEVRIRASFSAIHRLRLQDGRLEPRHGHDWKVEVAWRGATLDGMEVLVDFEEARAALDRVVARLHYQDLNDLAEFAGVNPSAERVARWIGQALQGCPRLGSALAAVYVEEAPGCTAGYLLSNP